MKSRQSWIRLRICRSHASPPRVAGVLRNPGDSHKLWVFDPAIRHRTDQVVLKFRKPG